MGLHMIERTFNQRSAGTQTPGTPKSPAPKKRKPNAHHLASVLGMDEDEMYDSDAPDMMFGGIGAAGQGVGKAASKGTGYAGAEKEDVSS